MIDFDYNAPIIPGESLGGLKIGQPIADLKERLSSLWISGHQAAVYPVSWKDINYAVTPELTIGVNILTGCISKIVAKSGYRGLFQDRIFIGMTCSQAKKLIPELYYDDIFSVLKVRGHKGICFQVEEEDPLKEKMWASPIAYATVMDDAASSEIYL